MKIIDIANINTEKIETSVLTRNTYISTENMMSNCGGVEVASSIPTGKVTSFCKDDTLISNIRPYFKKVWYARYNGGCSNDVICVRTKSEVCLPAYLYYALCTDKFIDIFSASSKGTKMPRGDKNALLSYDIPDRTITEQQHIVDILGSIDDKIENNTKIIEEYEKLLELYFEKLLSEKTDEWKEASLLDIADYTNGLAMQKFRPKGTAYLPVVKIKELSQGYVDANSEQADISISDKFIIDDGDIVFAWSGTLMVKIWCSGKGGLNQHLFKVTSEKFSKWFIYLWTKYHLIKFQNIAKGKAVTMGHIKRDDLAKSVALIPTVDILKKYESIIAPLYERIVSLYQENKTLSKLKTQYLHQFFG